MFTRESLCSPVSIVISLPSRCGNEGGKYCTKSDPDVRFYEVDVAATDSAGHIGKDTCRVVIVSGCDPLVSPFCETPASDANGKAEEFYFSKTYVDSAIGVAGQILHEVANLELSWEPGNLSTDLSSIVYLPQLPAPEAPVVQCTIGAQELCGHGQGGMSPGGYVDLKLSSTTIDGGVGYTAIEDLQLVVKVLSNEISGADEVRVCMKLPFIDQASTF